MSRLNPSAYTIIWCETADPDNKWYAHAENRAIAEIHYMKAIIAGTAHPPLYRVVMQYKVDQHAWPAMPSELRH